MPPAKLTPAQRRGLIVEYLSRDEPTTARVIWVFAFRGQQKDRECSLATIRADLDVLLTAGLVERVGGVGHAHRWTVTPQTAA